jgi:hypothetical protein
VKGAHRLPAPAWLRVAGAKPEGFTVRSRRHPTRHSLQCNLLALRNGPRVCFTADGGSEWQAALRFQPVTIGHEPAIRVDLGNQSHINVWSDLW